jgi:adenosine kinase
MKKIVVTGSLAFDYIMDFPGSYEEYILPDKIKTLSVSFLVDNLNKNFGGISGNIAYTLALLNSAPIILASAGEKDFEDYHQYLKEKGVETNFINIVPNEFSAAAYIMTDKNNCQITGFYPGAMNHDTSLAIPKETDFLIVAPTTSTAMESFIRQAKQRNIPYLFDPAQALTRLTGKQLTYCIDGADIVIGNDYEIALFMERTGLSKKQMLQLTKILITTLGSKGSIIETKDNSIEIGIAKPGTVTDPTGAGDAYIAGFIAGYTRQLSLQLCGQMGATAASFAIEHYGTQNHTFTLPIFEERYREAFQEMVELSE